jgi:hypothetical protein
MTERKLPPVGEWVPHDGGPRPVPEGTRLHRLYPDGSGRTANLPAFAENLAWSEVVAFCVTEYPDEKETRTGTFKVRVYADGRPAFFHANCGDPDFPTGTCTTTTVNGEVQEIHWKKGK